MTGDSDDHSEGDSGVIPREPVRVEPEPDAETIAAIAAALRIHRDAKTADRQPDSGDDWQGKRWVFAGRYELVTNRSIRPVDPLPPNAWRAGGRLDRP